MGEPNPGALEKHALAKDEVIIWKSTGTDSSQRER